MENIAILQEYSKSLYRITTNIDTKLYSTDNITQYLPAVKTLILISPFYTDPTPALSAIYKETPVQHTAHILPSIACTFAFKTSCIFYIYLNKHDTHISGFVEIVRGKKIRKPDCKVFEGDLYEVLNNIALLLNAHKQADKDALSSNIYVESEDLGLKRSFEEKMVMEIGKCVDVKYMYFLKMKEYLEASEYCHEGIVDQPVSVGGLIAGKVLVDNESFMSRAEYENGDFSKLKFYE